MYKMVVSTFSVARCSLTKIKKKTSDIGNINITEIFLCNKLLLQNSTATSGGPEFVPIVRNIVIFM